MTFPADMHNTNRKVSSQDQLHVSNLFPDGQWHAHTEILYTEKEIVNKIVSIVWPDNP